jgi:hypothetical protein
MTLLKNEGRFLDAVLGLRPRLLLLAAALLVMAACFLPLWKLTMFAPQYPDGLRLEIYSHRPVGGNHDQDINEINILNHYIGMRDLVAEDFVEFKWMPFALGALGLLFLRAMVLGKFAHLLDVLVLYFYFGAFSLWSFAYKLYRYGHDLSPTASVKVEPFMPPLFGHKTLANFEVYSYPGVATYAVAAAMVALAAAAVLHWRKWAATERGAR